MRAPSGGNGTVTLVFNTQLRPDLLRAGSQQVPPAACSYRRLFGQRGRYFHQIGGRTSAAGSLTSQRSTTASRLAPYRVQDGRWRAINAGQVQLDQGTAAARSVRPASATGSYETSNQIWGCGHAPTATPSAAAGNMAAPSAPPRSRHRHQRRLIVTPTLTAGVTCEASPTVLTSTDSTQDTAISVCDAPFAESAATAFSTRISRHAGSVLLMVAADNGTTGQSLGCRKFSRTSTFSGARAIAPMHRSGVTSPVCSPTPRCQSHLRLPCWLPPPSALEYLRRREVRKGSATA